VEILLEHGANINAEGGRHGNALYIASEGGHFGGSAGTPRAWKRMSTLKEDGMILRYKQHRGMATGGGGDTPKAWSEYQR